MGGFVNVGSDIINAYLSGKQLAERIRNQRVAEVQQQVENQQKQQQFDEIIRQFNEQIKQRSEEHKAEQTLKQAEHNLLVKKLKGEMSQAATKGAVFGPVTPVPAIQDQDYINNVIRGNFGAAYNMSQDMGPELGTLEYQTPQRQAQIDATLLEPQIQKTVAAYLGTLPGRVALAQIPAEAAALRQEKQLAFQATQNELNRKNARDIAERNIAGKIQAAAVGRQNQSNPTVLRIVQQHDQNPITKKFVTINEALQFVNNMPANSTNPADDQGLIYAFAKAMDPESVVREGEYKTVQTYSQSWLQKTGINLGRVLDNKAVLTPDARQKLKATILEKAQSVGRMYQDYRKTAIGRINRVAPNQGDSALGEFLAPGTTPSDTKTTDPDELRLKTLYPGAKIKRIK